MFVDKNRSFEISDFLKPEVFVSPLSAAAEAKSKPSFKDAWRQSFKATTLLQPSVLVLLIVNVLPLLGVLFWGWDLFLLLMLYWMETGIIGFWHFLKLGIVAKWLSLFLIPFFTVHFGGFMAGHFAFLYMLFGGGWQNQPQGGAWEFIYKIVWTNGLWLPFLAIFFSHGFSFFQNFIKSGLWRGMAFNAEGMKQNKEVMSDLMTAPYRRVVIMHVTIIFGAFLVAMTHNAKSVMVLMVVLKTATDLVSHVRKNHVDVPNETPNNLSS
jgi:hypothetical protein